MNSGNLTSSTIRQCALHNPRTRPKGKQVPEGVYYIVIEAEGADKVVYRKKGDINVLR